MADGPNAQDLRLSSKLLMSRAQGPTDLGLVCVRGARQNNLKNVDVDLPRHALVVFTGVSGSGKSSLAFGTLYAEAQRRYLESVSPYARRLFHQMAVPEVDEITGLPPAIALGQQRGGVTARSSVGSVTTLSNLMRMLYSRAGDYPVGQPLLYAESFSPNTAQGACARCQGVGRIYEVSEALMVPDDSLSIRERAVAAWPTAWQGQNLRDILTTLGHDVDVPWRTLPKKTRDWILYTEDQPTVPVYAGFDLAEVKRALKRKEEPSYQGTFSSARRHVLTSFAKAQRIKLATELQRTQQRGTLYVLDEPTTGLHPADVERLLKQLQRLVDAGASVIVVEHDLQVMRACDWLIDLGPGAGDEGGKVVAAGPPATVAGVRASRTAAFLSAPTSVVESR